MSAKSLDLVWIPVKDFKKAIKFYTEVVGLKLLECNEEWGWAELEGKNGGIRLGIGQHRPQEDTVAPGQNAVMTFTVANIENAVKDLRQKGATLVGEVQEVPGNVKLQMVKDVDGNHFHLAESICEETPKESHHHHGGCCKH